MKSALDQYRKKRDFNATPEPTGGRRRAGAALRFVVQKHAASHLHYDFRLELDGTLKSWAIPKGPSLDPHQRRMAMHVEDHPLDYASFEGSIPAGQYGAGNVIVWDAGTWTPVGDGLEGYRSGKLKFELRGHKLRGHFMLVRMHGRQNERQDPWLLIKERDGEARPASEYQVTEAEPDSVLSGQPLVPRQPRQKKPAARGEAPARGEARARQLRAPRTPAETLIRGTPQGVLPRSLSPHLATLVTEPPTTGEWSWEIKFDGYRILARIDAQVRLFSRNGHDWTARLPGLVHAIEALGLPPSWLDGEIVIADAHGRSDFQALQNAFDEKQQEQAPIQYYVFDLPYYDHRDLRQVPLKIRREVLAGLLVDRADSPVRFSAAFSQPVDDLFASACKLGLEGLIGKRTEAPYASARNRDWIKLKCQQRQEFVIGGYTDPKGSRQAFGALLLGVFEPDHKLRYVGNVGTGFSEATLGRLFKQLAPLERASSAFSNGPKGRDVHWLEPRLVAEISFAAWTQDNRLRHPVFLGLREDKHVGQVSREIAQAAPRSRTTSRAPKTAAKAAMSAIKISHPERVIDPHSGLTKGDLVAYYDAIASRMLPYLHGRPVSLVRAPDGIDKPLFFQKHAGTLHLGGIAEHAGLLAGHPPVLTIDSALGLRAVAQMNCVELHTWGAVVDAIETPDCVIFDLDPGEGIVFEQVIEASCLTIGLLDALGLRVFVKTSGGRGMHLVVPLQQRYSWEAVRAFSHAVVKHLARMLPDRFVAKSGPGNRIGKIFVDYLRNNRGATTAAPYSARARPGLGVSMPIAQDQIMTVSAADQWTVANAMDELKRRHSDPWAEFATSAQRLDAAASQLGVALAP